MSPKFFNFFYENSIFPTKLRHLLTSKIIKKLLNFFFTKNSSKITQFLPQKQPQNYFVFPHKNSPKLLHFPLPKIIPTLPYGFPQKTPKFTTIFSLSFPSSKLTHFSLHFPPQICFTFCHHSVPIFVTIQQKSHFSRFVLASDLLCTAQSR
jgi:hypothetical protein